MLFPPLNMASRAPLFASSVFVFVLVAMAAVAVSTNPAAHPLHSSSHSTLPPCTWCVCKDGPEAVLQKTLDYACGHGADCNPIKPNGGACYATVGPGSVRAHCSYAVNSYYHKMNQAGGTCDFSNTATITTTDPSFSGCSFPASASSSSSATPVTTVPSTTPMTPRTTPVTSPIYGNTPKTSSSPPYYTTSTPPYTGATPSTGGLGGDFAPPGMGIYDDSNAGVMTLASTSVALCSILAVLTLHMWK